MKRPTSRKPAHRALILAAAMLGTVLPAAAQEPAGVENVVVTAEKTTESILNVGINVTAISGADLRASRVATPTDLATQIPNVDVKTNIPGAQQIITVRGVGLDDFSSTNNSSVGVYVDDVFLASFAEMDFNFYDLERVEVLKGPQGTLYGRNSTAGAINVISARPSLDGFEGRISAGYGNFETFDAEAMLNIPVSDDLALRFSGKTVQQGEGYWYSRVLHRDLGRQDVFLGRGQALWTPNADWTVLLKVEGESNHSEIGVGKFFGTIPLTAAPCPDFGNPSHCVNAHLYTDTTKDPFTGDWNHTAPYHVNQINGTLHVEGDLGWAQLTSVTGLINFKREFYIDADAAPTRDAEFDQNDHVNQFSEELRLNGTVDRLDWLAGAYYSHDHVHSFTPGTLIDLLGVNVFIQSRQTTRSAAAFGQVKYTLTDQLNITGGLRYTSEDRAYVGGTNLLFGPFIVGSTFINAKIHDRNWSWRGALNWKPDEQTLFYVSISRATKSGGFFNGITTVNAALAPYKPEELTDYEAGVKAQLLDNRLYLDGSVFYYDYTDLQAQTFTNVGAVSLIKLSNIHKARIYGLDLGATWMPVAGLTLRGGIGLLHTRLGAFPFATAFGPVINPAGNRLPDAPNTTFSGLARYEHAVLGDFVGALQFEGHYASDSYKEALNLPYLFTNANWVFDGRVSIATQDEGWELALWGKNIFDEQHVVQATDDGIGMGYRIFNAPRTIGVTLSHHFD